MFTHSNTRNSATHKCRTKGGEISDVGHRNLISDRDFKYHTLSDISDNLATLEWQGKEGSARTGGAANRTASLQYLQIARAATS